MPRSPSALRGELNEAPSVPGASSLERRLLRGAGAVRRRGLLALLRRDRGRRLLLPVHELVGGELARRLIRLHAELHQVLRRPTEVADDGYLEIGDQLTGRRRVAVPRHLGGVVLSVQVAHRLPLRVLRLQRRRDVGHLHLRRAHAEHGARGDRSEEAGQHVADLEVEASEFPDSIRLHDFTLFLTVPGAHRLSPEATGPPGSSPVWTCFVRRAPENARNTLRTGEEWAHGGPNRLRRKPRRANDRGIKSRETHAHPLHRRKRRSSQDSHGGVDASPPRGGGATVRAPRVRGETSHAKLRTGRAWPRTGRAWSGTGRARSRT